MMEYFDLSQILEEVEKLNSKDGENRRRHILVVDDDVRVLRLLKVHLQDYDVATAINGKLALKFLENKTTDLILLDYEMPEMNGKEVLQKLQAEKEYADIPVVFLTSMDNREMVMELLALKPAGYILKPTDSQMLLERVENIIGK